MEQIPYGESEHVVNPFRTDDQTSQAIYTKNASPALVEFCRYEAKPVEIPLFGKNRNVTLEGQLAKDPATFALLKVAQSIHEQWVAEDRAAAQQQRAEAEAALKKLAEAAA
jgi:hypothetical protein